MIITHILVQKLQAAEWTTVNSGLESQTTLSIGIFTPTSKAMREQIAMGVEDVSMNKPLDQAVQHCSAINRTLTKSYKIKASMIQSKPWRHS